MTTIIQHLDAIEHRELVLPEFQREYVWTKEQAKQLMVSLYRGYPTGSLLFWETTNPPDIKNNSLPKNFVGRIRVLLDGQQRLTTLYLLIKGQIPPYYTQEDIINDPRELRFHLLTHEFEYYGPVKIGINPLWIKVADFFMGIRPNIIDVAQKQAPLLGRDPMELANELYASFTDLDRIKQQEYPVQTIPTDADIDAAIDVFDRVNSLGTKITEAELALAHMAGRWPEIRRIFKRKIDQLSEQGITFTLDFLVRCMTGIISGGALYTRVHKASRQDLEIGWSKLDGVLDTVVSFLHGRAFIHSHDDLSTLNVLVPIIVYLAKHEGQFVNDRQIRRFLYWMYQALLWGRYSGQTDQRLERDIKHASTVIDPVDALLNEIIDVRGRLDVRAADLEGRGIDHPIFRIMHVVAKSRGAADWFTGIPLAGNSSLARGENYYIFPSSVLYKSGQYTNDNHIHKKMINEIANRVILTRWKNSEESPDKILAEVNARFPDALAQQFVPTDPSLWTIDKFENFLQLRREMIAQAINNYLASLTEARIPEHVFPQIAKISDPAVAVEARRGVEKLTVEDVDLGLFLLGKLFENTLKGFMQLAETLGAYAILPSNYSKLQNMIDWTKSQQIIKDSTALHLLRQQRNDRAHGQAPSPEERQIMFNSAGWIASIYLDYILLFSEKRQELLTSNRSGAITNE